MDIWMVPVQSPLEIRYSSYSPGDWLLSLSTMMLLVLMACPPVATEEEDKSYLDTELRNNHIRIYFLCVTVDILFWGTLFSCFPFYIYINSERIQTHSFISHFVMLLPFVKNRLFKK